MRTHHSSKPQSRSRPALALRLGISAWICGLAFLPVPAAGQDAPRKSQPPQRVEQANPFPQGDGELTIGSIGLIDVHANAANGLVVCETIPNTVAANNGLEPGDVITRVNGRTMRQPQDLNNALQDAGGGAEVRIEGVNVRGGDPINFVTQLPNDDNPRLGVRTFANRASGIRIGDVDPEGIVAKAGGFERGDLITRVNGRSVRTLRELEQALARVAAGEDVAIDGVNVRDGQPLETLRFQAGDGGHQPRPPVGGLTTGGIGLVAIHACAANGLVISETIADSLAAANGLEPGDVLLRINGRALRQPQDLNAILSDAGAGAEIQVEGVNVRDGSPINFVTQLPNDDNPRLGVRTFAHRTSGVRISDVDPEGIIAKVGNLERGDLITRVNGRQIRTVRDLDDALARIRSGDNVVIDGINVRDGQPFETVQFRAGQ